MVIGIASLKQILEFKHFFLILLLCFLINVIKGKWFLNVIRLEKVNFKQKPSLAKVIGTAITLTGAMLMTLYKGPIVDILWYSKASSHQNTSISSADQHWVTGTIMLLSCTCGWSGFFILQVSLLYLLSTTICAKFSFFFFFFDNRKSEPACA